MSKDFVNGGRIYNICRDTYTLHSRWAKSGLHGDSDWIQFIEECDAITKKYKYDKFAIDMFNCVINELEERFPANGNMPSVLRL